MRAFLIGLITLYRYCLSPLLGPSCRFHPSCSCYAQQSIGRLAFREQELLLGLSQCKPRPVPGPRPDQQRAEITPSDPRRPRHVHR